MNTYKILLTTGLEIRIKSDSFDITLGNNSLEFFKETNGVSILVAMFGPNQWQYCELINKE